MAAQIVPLHIYIPAPAFKNLTGGHRLIDHPFHEAQCFDCLKIGSSTVFTAGVDGCPARPESLRLSIVQHEAASQDAVERAEASAGLYRKFADRILLPIDDWRALTNHPTYCAYFTFRDREYGVKYGMGYHRLAAEKLPNRGQPEPERVNVQWKEAYKQVVLRF